MSSSSSFGDAAGFGDCGEMTRTKGSSRRKHAVLGRRSVGFGDVEGFGDAGGFDYKMGGVGAMTLRSRPPGY